MLNNTELADLLEKLSELGRESGCCDGETECCTVAGCDCKTQYHTKDCPVSVAMLHVHYLRTGEDMKPQITCHGNYKKCSCGAEGFLYFVDSDVHPRGFETICGGCLKERVGRKDD